MLHQMMASSDVQVINVTTGPAFIQIIAALRPMQPPIKREQIAFPGIKPPECEADSSPSVERLVWLTSCGMISNKSHFLALICN